MSLSERPHRVRNVLFLMVLAALAIRLVVMVFQYQARLDPGRDHWEFGFETGRIARSIASGEGFGNPLFGNTGPTAWMAPVYPYLLAAVFKLFGIYSKTSALVILSLNSLFSVDMGELPHHSRTKPAFPNRTAPRAYDLPCGLGGLWRALGLGRVDQPHGPLRAAFPVWMGLLPFPSTGEALGVSRSNDTAGAGRHSYALVHAELPHLPSVYSFPRQLRVRTARWQ